MSAENIPYLSTEYRIKELPSFLEKIERKNYEDPLEQCEDLCGVRVICYYLSDVDRIADIVRREFNVLESIDKAQLLHSQEFGYRSVHFVVRINKAWLRAPNYRGLGNLKAEIQIRTVLMHAWAEIEHKLAYKKADQVPEQLKRKLSRLSAKFEEADEQFQEIRDAAANYQQQIKEDSEKKGGFITRQPLNLDSLQAFLDYHFPDRERNTRSHIRNLLGELQGYGITFTDMVNAHAKASQLLQKYEDAVFQGRKMAQVGALRATLDIGYDGYFDSRSTEWITKTPFDSVVTTLRKEMKGEPA